MVCDTEKGRTVMNMFTSAILTLILLVSMGTGTTAKTWSVRYIEPASAKLFKPIITANGITIQSLGTDVTQRKDHPEYISLHCRLPDAITAGVIRLHPDR